MEIVSDVTRTAAWELRYDLERQTRYYHAMADRLKGRHFRVRFILLLAVLVEGMFMYFTTASVWFWWPVVGLGIGIAILAVWDCSASTTSAGALPHSNRYSTKVVASTKMLPKTRDPAAPTGPDRIDSDTGPIPDRRTRGRTGDGANDDFALRKWRKPAAQALLLGLVVPWVFLCTLMP